MPLIITTHLHRRTRLLFTLRGAPSRFGEGKRLQLLRIGIQGRVVPDENRKDATLTFVIDVSGSMAMENRLGLVKRALTLLVEQLRPGDEVAIVVYGTRARTVLPHTGIEGREEILEAIHSLTSDGEHECRRGAPAWIQARLAQCKGW